MAQYPGGVFGEVHCFRCFEICFLCPAINSRFLLEGDLMGDGKGEPMILDVCTRFERVVSWSWVSRRRLVGVLGGERHWGP